MDVAPITSSKNVARDAYHQTELLWRRVRDYEGAQEMLGPEKPLSAQCVLNLLQNPRNDPRCVRVDGPIEAYALHLAAGDGVFLLPNALGLSQQRVLLRELVTRWVLPPNRSNLWPSSCTDCQLRQGMADFSSGATTSCFDKLRWVTLGLQYDWSNPCYLDIENSPLPDALSDIATSCTSVLPLPSGVEVRAFDAAICNLYHASRRPSDRLGGHQDRVEENPTEPLVSVSVGLPCVFLLGGVDRACPPTPVLLRGGSVLVLSGPSRRAFHGVPTVLVPPEMQPRGRGHPRPRKAGGPDHTDVYRPWEVGTSPSLMPGNLECDCTGPPEFEASIDHILSRVRVNFSIRSAS